MSRAERAAWEARTVELPGPHGSASRSTRGHTLAPRPAREPQPCGAGSTGAARLSVSAAAAAQEVLGAAREAATPAAVTGGDEDPGPLSPLPARLHATDRLRRSHISDESGNRAATRAPGVRGGQVRERAAVVGRRSGELTSAPPQPARRRRLARGPAAAIQAQRARAREAGPVVRGAAGGVSGFQPPRRPLADAPGSTHGPRARGTRVPAAAPAKRLGGGGVHRSSHRTGEEVGAGCAIVSSRDSCHPAAPGPDEPRPGASARWAPLLTRA